MSGFTKPVQLPVGVAIEGFECGDDIVDGWARKHSAHARQRGTAVVYASFSDGQVAGFYTLSTHSVRRSEAASWLARNAPEDIPAVLLGMLGVDKKFKGRGLGASLLKDAVENSGKVAALAGARALVVDPTGADAASFYEHFGFMQIPGSSRMALKLPANP